jgi:hypothetical protein
MVLDNSLRFMKAAILKSKFKRLLPQRMSKSIGPSRLQIAQRQRRPLHLIGPCGNNLDLLPGRSQSARF